ncbi:putative uncharacterized protein DDB_G0271606 [Eurosta solidaginis]|uniref:putative uncharacterized protein DDB_G0271606 n=1 Tax=Eurosta solidaginis TaxID=178769 RepID=UPI0035310635
MDARCLRWLCFAGGNSRKVANTTIIKITKTTTTLRWLTHLPKTNASYVHANNYNNTTVVKKINNSAYRAQQRPELKHSKGSSSAWLTLACTNSNRNHRINLPQKQLTGIHFIASVIFRIDVAFVAANLPDFSRSNSCNQPLQENSLHPIICYSPLAMGSCFGRFVAKHARGANANENNYDDIDAGNNTTLSCLWRKQNATDEQEAELVSIASDKCPKENFIYRIMKFKAKEKRSQFIDKFWEENDLQYTKLSNRNGSEGLSDIQLQNLDVNNLLSNTILAKESALNYCMSEAQYAAASSRASSSLDLEWEHEYGHIRQIYQQQPHSAHRSTQSLLLTTNNSKNNLTQYANSNITPTHQLHVLNNNNNKLSNSNNIHAFTTYDNHPLQVHLSDSWQYLSNDEEQINSLASYAQNNSQSQSLPDATLNPAATSQVTTPLRTTGERNEQRLRMRRSTQPVQQSSINERRNNSFTRSFSSQNSWSHISTPESLEWDQDEEQQRQLRVEDDNLDHQTLELLHQIEQLKNRVLDETGDGLFDNEQMAGDTRGGINFIVGGLCTAENESRNICS